MLGFGCSVIAYDIYESDELKSKGVKYVTLDKLFEASDIISMHCPLTPEKQKLCMLNETAFVKMKKGVMVINTGRGALINTKDAIKALKDEKLGYLGIDVYEQETNIFSATFQKALCRMKSFQGL